MNDENLDIAFGGLLSPGAWAGRHSGAGGVSAARSSTALASYFTGVPHLSDR